MPRPLAPAYVLFSVLIASPLVGCHKTDPRIAAAATVGAEGAVFPGKPVVRYCKKEWSQERCCAFLCSALNAICTDSPRAKPGIDTCPTWCPTLADKAVRCHVYHAFDSVSPTGGIKDHDSHCRHAANQLKGGACPPVLFE